MKNWVWISKPWESRDQGIPGTSCPAGVAELVTSRFNERLSSKNEMESRYGRHQSLTFNLHLHMHALHTYTHIHTKQRQCTEQQTSYQSNVTYFRTDHLNFHKASEKQNWEICAQFYLPKLTLVLLPDCSLNSAKMETWDLLASLLVFGGSVPYLMMSLSFFTIVSKKVWWYFKVFFI